MGGGMMYLDHFGLQALPFENVPDPSFFYDEGDFHRVLLRMQDAFSAGRGLLAISGPIGAGKTTLSQKLMAGLGDDVIVIWSAEPPETAMELFRFLAEEIGAEGDDSSRVFILRNIRRQLQALRRGGRRCLMIVDESHLMSDEVIEGVRLLNNLEEGPSKLIQIILLGQQELMERLTSPDLEAFRQRIAGLEILGKMDAERVKNYVLHRLHVAGAGGPVFTDRALEAIAAATGGVPRKTNSLCNNSLMAAYDAGREAVEAEDVHKAATDLGMGRMTMHFLLREKSAGAPPRLQEPAPAQALPPADPRPPSAAAEPPAARSAAAADGQEDVPPPGRRAPLPAPDFSTPLPAEPGLAFPVLLFLSSLAAFAGSLIFYCRRAGSLAPEGCVESLLMRLF